MDSLNSSGSKKQSKWDKPERPITRPINRPIDEENTIEGNQSNEINPPVDITKNLVAKFKVYEQGTGTDAAVRKPVRPITPPRELEGGGEGWEGGEVSRRQGGVPSGVVVSSLDKVESAEELPPPEITKNLLARWEGLFNSRVNNTRVANYSLVFSCLQCALLPLNNFLF